MNKLRVLIIVLVLLLIVGCTEWINQPVPLQRFNTSITAVGPGFFTPVVNHVGSPATFTAQPTRVIIVIPPAGTPIPIEPLEDEFFVATVKPPG